MDPGKNQEIFKRPGQKTDKRPLVIDRILKTFSKSGAICQVYSLLPV